MTKPTPRYECLTHPFAWVALAEVGDTSKPRVCQFCVEAGVPRAEAQMVLVREEAEVPA